MRILVAVKRVVDYSVKIRVLPTKKAVDLNNVKMQMNPFCEIAVEEATKLKERGIAKEIIAVSIGGKQSQETLRTALAMGADSAIHIETDLRLDQELQPLAVAKLLQKVVESKKPDFVLLGKQAIDDDNNQTGQMLAGLLNWPQCTFASKIDFAADAKSVEVTREGDGGLQTVKSNLPLVATVDLRLNSPRYATLPNIMKAKKKPLEILQAKDMGIDLTPRLKVSLVEEPPKRIGGGKVESVSELISKLQKEKGLFL